MFGSFLVMLVKSFFSTAVLADKASLSAVACSRKSEEGDEDTGTSRLLFHCRSCAQCL